MSRHLAAKEDLVPKADKHRCGFPCLLWLLQVLVDTWEEPYWPSLELVRRGETGGEGWEGETTLDSEDNSLSCPAPFLPVSSFPLPLPPPLFPPPFAST